MSNTNRVHNHGPWDGPGLDCPEYRDEAGKLRGRCLDAIGSDS